MKLGLVLSTGSPRDFAHAAALAKAARRRAFDVSLFLMDRAVDLAAGGDVTELLDEGCDVVVCASSVEQRRAAPPVAGVLLGSQDDHAAIVHRADKVVAFT